jgi:hypothetical protein
VTYPPPIAKEAPPPARCLGDEIRERAVREGRIGYVPPLVQTASRDKQRLDARAEAERLASWIAAASPGWPPVIKTDWILDEIPDDVLDDGSRDRGRVILARAVLAAGWRKVRGYSGQAASYFWARGADVVRLDGMTGRQRAAALREAPTAWSRRQGIETAEAAE